MARSRSQRKSRIAKNSRSRGNDENWITYHKTEAIKWRKIKTAIKKIPFRLEQFIYIYILLCLSAWALDLFVSAGVFFLFCKCLSSSLFSYATAICGDYNMCMLFISHKKNGHTVHTVRPAKWSGFFSLAYLFMQFCNIWNVTKSQQQPADCLQSQWPKQKKHRHHCGILFYIMRQFITNNHDSHHNKNSKT